MENHDDKHLQELLSRAETQREGFELMVRQYSEQLYWQVRRIVLTHEDVNDVLQNAFIKAWNGLASFHGDSKVLTWLSRIAINESIDFVRRQKNLTMVSADDTELSVSNTLMADEYFDGDSTEAQLQEAIASLPDVQRTVFTLRYFEEMRYSDMSKLLGTSEGSLKASYHIAVKKITEYFKARD
ncbi:MAG: sigma-70 family RNA polymerase sigma factor [Prevotella sp.]|nr:sigma-70 family RNA polymerase sigma factor [Prevotella sp.]